MNKTSMIPITSLFDRRTRKPSDMWQAVLPQQNTIFVAKMYQPFELPFQTLF